MRIRRYYNKGEKYKVTYSDKYLEELKEKGAPVDLIDTAENEIILSRTEQEQQYAECLQRVIDNPRAILDELENLPEFKVNWKNYKEWDDGKHSC